MTTQKRKYVWAISPERKAQLVKDRIAWMQAGTKAKREQQAAESVNTPADSMEAPNGSNSQVP